MKGRVRRHSLSEKGHRGGAKGKGAKFQLSLWPHGPGTGEETEGESEGKTGEEEEQRND